MTWCIIMITIEQSTASICLRVSYEVMIIVSMLFVQIVGGLLWDVEVASSWKGQRNVFTQLGSAS